MIEVSHLTKMYGPRAAISDLNFEVKEGEIVGFLGPNGAGKTTTMSILTGFIPATSGTAKIAGHDVFDEPMEVKKNIGYLPESPPVYTDMVVRDYIEYAGRLRGMRGAALTKGASDVIEKTGLGEVRGRLIGNLSKGYRQRVGLAQALVHNPKVLILDEPTVGLDPKQILEIRTLIKGLAGDHTVILSSHILPEVTATCERIIVINKGQIVARDTLEGLTSHLRKGQVLNLEVRDRNHAGIEAIRKIKGVRDVTSDGSRVIIEVDREAGEIRDRIVESAVTNRMGVLEFRSEQVSLEDVFLQLTTDESAERGYPRGSQYESTGATL